MRPMYPICHLEVLWSMPYLYIFMWNLEAYIHALTQESFATHLMPRSASSHTQTTNQQLTTYLTVE